MNTGERINTFAEKLEKGDFASEMNEFARSGLASEIRQKQDFDSVLRFISDKVNAIHVSNSELRVKKEGYQSALDDANEFFGTAEKVMNQEAQYQATIENREKNSIGNMRKFVSDAINASTLAAKYKNELLPNIAKQTNKEGIENVLKNFFENENKPGAVAGIVVNILDSFEWEFQN